MKKEIIETGVMFRGFTIVNHFFKSLPELKNLEAVFFLPL